MDAETRYKYFKISSLKLNKLIWVNKDIAPGDISRRNNIPTFPQLYIFSILFWPWVIKLILKKLIWTYSFLLDCSGRLKHYSQLQPTLLVRPSFHQSKQKLYPWADKNEEKEYSLSLFQASSILFIKCKNFALRWFVNRPSLSINVWATYPSVR